MQFTDLPLDHRIIKVLTTKGLTAPTEIQQHAIPHALLGKDLLASSKTGSGKTLAFLLPALQRVLKQKPLSRKDPRVLVLAPTRELAKQVYGELKGLLQGLNLHVALVLGGENFNDQVKTLRRNPQFIVGTAGRVADHILDRSLYLNGLEMLIFDEADRMLDLGFAAQLRIIDKAADHRKRQTLMFSATLEGAEMHDITQNMLNAPQRISMDDASVPHQDISQHFYLSDHIEHKEAQLLALLPIEGREQIIVFVATREDAARLADKLNEEGHSAVGLSAELTQSQRNNIMNSFSRGQHHILVTTDVASRGLDLLNVARVINFDLPKLSDEYVHRIGRTGRAGNKGEAFSLVGPKDWRSFKRIVSFLNLQVQWQEIGGLPATFKGLQDRPKTNKSGKPRHKGSAKPRKATTGKPAGKKRVNTMEGVDVGHIPMKRKPRTSQSEEE